MIEKLPLSLTVNGAPVGPVDVPIGMPMVDFLHEYLNLTGTRFGCGQGLCHACAIIEIGPGGEKTESRTCIFDAHYFDGKSIQTIEGHAERDASGEITRITPVQRAFVEHFSFQCGYCTPGFVTGATVFLDGLTRQPVRRAELEGAIEAALDVHLCRCTGYVRYYEAIRDLALATPGCVVG